MKKDKIPSLEEQLAYLESVKDEDIDFSDIPEIKSLKGAITGKFYVPAQEQVNMQIDTDILEWFKSHSPKYQAAINQALREYITAKMSLPSKYAAYPGN